MQHGHRALVQPQLAGGGRRGRPGVVVEQRLECGGHRIGRDGHADHRRRPQAFVEPRQVGDDHRRGRPQRLEHGVGHAAVGAGRRDQHIDLGEVASYHLVVRDVGEDVDPRVGSWGRAALGVGDDAQAQIRVTWPEAGERVDGDVAALAREVVTDEPDGPAVGPLGGDVGGRQRGAAHLDVTRRRAARDQVLAEPLGVHGHHRAVRAPQPRVVHVQSPVEAPLQRGRQPETGRGPGLTGGVEHRQRVTRARHHRNARAHLADREEVLVDDVERAGLDAHEPDGFAEHGPRATQRELATAHDEDRGVDPTEATMARTAPTHLHPSVVDGVDVGRVAHARGWIDQERLGVDHVARRWVGPADRTEQQHLEGRFVCLVRWSRCGPAHGSSRRQLG